MEPLTIAAIVATIILTIFMIAYVKFMDEETKSFVSGMSLILPFFTLVTLIIASSVVIIIYIISLFV